jgi:hypothetical protein
MRERPTATASVLSAFPSSASVMSFKIGLAVLRSMLASSIVGLLRYLGSGFVALFLRGEAGGGQGGDE